MRSVARQAKEDGREEDGRIEFREGKGERLGESDALSCKK
jgi:hypothetical protein